MASSRYPLFLAKIQHRNIGDRCDGRSSLLCSFAAFLSTVHFNRLPSLIAVDQSSRPSKTVVRAALEIDLRIDVIWCRLLEVARSTYVDITFVPAGTRPWSSWSILHTIVPQWLAY